jgi:transcriptional regulator with XRE-family HTH domain
MMCTMTREWERRLAAVKTEREKRGLTQVELADAAGVTESTVQNLEGGRTYKRKPESLDIVWAALRPDGAGPAADQDDSATIPPRQAAVPLRVQHELSEGEVVDTDVIDLSRGGMKMVVVVTRDPASPAIDPDAVRDDYAEWTRVQRAIRKIADGDADAATG